MEERAPMTRPDCGEMAASLHARYRAQVHGYVTRLLTDRQLAEDAVQETMLRGHSYPRDRQQHGPADGRPRR